MHLHPNSLLLCSLVYVPVLHAGQLGGGLFEVVVIAVGEGAQAASNQGHCAESSAGMAGCVGAGGVLLAVLPPIAWGLQTMVRACKRHLHGSWKNVLVAPKEKLLFMATKCLRSSVFCLLDFGLVLVM